jgi:hypothetical protein
MRLHVFGFALLSAIAIVANAPAHAQNGTLTRSFVSSTGLDSNACTITAPCATFAVAYTKIGANGIIAALDPGKYGPLTITGPVTVNGNGWAAITAPANSNGITVNIPGGTGNVHLTGLEIDGAGTAYNGIVFYSGSSLTVIDCVLKDFITSGGNGAYGNGIFVQPNSSTTAVLIKNTTVLSSGNAGIYLTPSGSAAVYATLDQVTTDFNNYGMFFDASGTNQFLTATVTNSQATYNTTRGITVSGLNQAGAGANVTLVGVTSVLNDAAANGGNPGYDLWANGGGAGVSLVHNNTVGYLGNNGGQVATDGTTIVLYGVVTGSITSNYFRGQ